MKPTHEDILAAQTVMVSFGPSHPNVIGLEGAALCYHRLVGVGSPLDDFIAEWGKDYAGEYEATPYRHHVCSRALDARGYCRCGNEPSSIIHRRCWEGEALQ